jgi:hypothetical protein
LAWELFRRLRGRSSVLSERTRCLLAVTCQE